jgi:oligopeptide transport system permease protein
MNPKSAIMTNGAVDEVEQGTSLWRDAWHRLSRNKLAVTGGAILLLITLVCFTGPLFAQPHDKLDLDLKAAPPSMEHWLGTDTLETFTNRLITCAQGFLN